MQSDEPLNDSNSGVTLGDLKDLQSKKYLIIYADVVGYMEFRDNRGERELFASLKIARGMMENFNLLRAAGVDGTSHKFDCGMKMFTDHILIYVGIEEDEYDCVRLIPVLGLYAILQYEIQNDCNFSLRGAVTHGNCYISDFIFGDPILNAIGLEKKAFWPRAVVPEDTFDMLKGFIPENRMDIIHTGADGVHFLNYLGLRVQHEIENGGSPLMVLEKHKNAILRLYKAAAIPEDIMNTSMLECKEMGRKNEKYRLLFEYHNKICDDCRYPEMKMDFKDDRFDTFVEECNSYERQLRETDYTNMGRLRGALDRLLEKYMEIFRSQKVED